MQPVPAPAWESLKQSYRSGAISRREFFQKLAYLTGSIILAHEIMLAEGFAFEWEAYDWPDPQAIIDQIVKTIRLFNDNLNVKIALMLLKEKIWVK